MFSVDVSFKGQVLNYICQLYGDSNWGLFSENSRFLASESHTTYPLKGKTHIHTYSKSLTQKALKTKDGKHHIILWGFENFINRIL